jgi:hypothetical protein
MPRLTFCLLAPLFLFLSGCTMADSHPPAPAAPLSTGFWYWDRDTRNARPTGAAVDDLFVLACNFDSSPGAGGYWAEIPEYLPAARAYWLVLRWEGPGVPAPELLPPLTAALNSLRNQADQRRLPIAGFQFDVDSPTASLPAYAEFLGAVRRQLPAGTQLSITALLDWFRPSTAIAAVVAQTDEFVPQFYDTAESGRAIAAPLEAARWGPVFNRFRKPFRIGISTFGRARRLNDRSGYGALYHDIGPLDVAFVPGLTLQPSTSPAGELLLNCSSRRAFRAQYNPVEPGVTLQFILPTYESVARATAAARSMGGYLRGVLYFRWAEPTDPLALSPAQVLAGTPPADRLQAAPGGCAAVTCTDLFYEASGRLVADPVVWRIRSSAPLQYFIPEKNVPIRATGPTQMELRLPPYTTRGRLYLGRAVSSRATQFTLEPLP